MESIPAEADKPMEWLSGQWGGAGFADVTYAVEFSFTDNQVNQCPVSAIAVIGAPKWAAGDSRPCENALIA